MGTIDIMTDVGGAHEVRLPTSPGAEQAWLDLGEVGVCARHGEPAVRRVRWAVSWQPTYRGEARAGRFVVGGSPVGNVARGVRRVAETVRVDARGWPVCARCDRSRRGWRTLTVLLLVVGVLGVVGAAATAAVGGPQPWLAVPLLGGAALVLVSVVPFVLGSWPRITRAAGTPDASAVVVSGAHERFRAAAQG